jgi:plastocyanin
MRKIMLVMSMMLAISLVLGFAVRAQDQPSADGTPGADQCATPVAQMDGSPEAVVTALGTPGTPVICPSPVMGGQTGGTAVTIEMVDIAFEPKEVTIAANTDVTVTLTNTGAAAHNFHIDELNIQTEDVPSGGSTTVTINAPAGTYEFYCAVPGHREAGMVGTLTVQ